MARVVASRLQVPPAHAIQHVHWQPVECPSPGQQPSLAEMLTIQQPAVLRQILQLVKGQPSHDVIGNELPLIDESLG